MRNHAKIGSWQELFSLIFNKQLRIDITFENNNVNQFLRQKGETLTEFLILITSTINLIYPSGRGRMCHKLKLHSMD